MMPEQNVLTDPDSLLPDQFYEDTRLPAEVGSERKLMLAILQDAVECYQRNIFARDPHGKNELAEARSWIESREHRWVFSFENICGVLGIDADYVRDALARLSQRMTYGDNRERITPYIAPLELIRGATATGELGDEVQIAS